MGLSSVEMNSMFHKVDSSLVKGMYCISASLPDFCPT